MRSGYFNPLLAPVRDQHDFYALLLLGGGCSAALSLPALALLTKEFLLINQMNAIILYPAGW